MSDASHSDAPMAAAPKKPRSERRAREKRDGPYTKFLEWASLSLPGFWRMRMDILLIGYLVLFLGAISTPVTLSALAGPDDQGYNCREFRGQGQFAEPAAAAPEPAVAPLYTQADLDGARANLASWEAERIYWAGEMQRLGPAALAAGASEESVRVALEARSEVQNAEWQVANLRDQIANIEYALANPVSPAPAAEPSPDLQDLSLD